MYGVTIGEYHIENRTDILSLTGIVIYVDIENKNTHYLIPYESRKDNDQDKILDNSSKLIETIMDKIEVEGKNNCITEITQEYKKNIVFTPKEFYNRLILKDNESLKEIIHEGIMASRYLESLTYNSKHKQKGEIEIKYRPLPEKINKELKDIIIEYQKKNKA